MRASSKLKVFLIIFFISIFAIIAARHFIGLHFKKKFSIRPAPGVIVEEVEKSLFFKSIETFGTALAQNAKTYRIKTNDVAGKLNIDNRIHEKKFKEKVAATMVIKKICEYLKLNYYGIKKNKAGKPFKKNFTVNGIWCEASGYIQEDKSIKIRILKTSSGDNKAPAAPKAAAPMADAWDDQF